ncbi:MAG: DUF447 domain-containing protein, partial [Candidatus Acidiferrum sp.]
MILEGIVTTIGPGDAINIAPMGPRVNASLTRLILRPFQSSRTYGNLLALPEGVFHVTDDVLMLARAAIGRLDPSPRLSPAKKVRGWIIAAACKAFEFQIVHADASGERAELTADVVETARFRDFVGFNRAKHAVVEAAILATRVALLPREEIQTQFDRLAGLVEKTGGEEERSAFALLGEYVRESFASKGLPEESYT